MIVTLVLLVVIGLLSTASMRGALNADMISHNVRTQTFAEQAAQIALRYCESEVVKATPGITIEPAPVAPATAAWASFSNWHGSTPKAVRVPAEKLHSEVSSVEPSDDQLPQCLAERAELPSGEEVTIVTARGFSPDYREDDDGNTIAGSVVWLQSTLRLGS